MLCLASLLMPLSSVLHVASAGTENNTVKNQLGGLFDTSNTGIADIALVRLRLVMLLALLQASMLTAASNTSDQEPGTTTTSLKLRQNSSWRDRQTDRETSRPAHPHKGLAGRKFYSKHRNRDFCLPEILHPTRILSDGKANPRTETPQQKQSFRGSRGSGCLRPRAGRGLAAT